MYGPTTGDRVRLGDTDLIIEVEKDFCTYGEECKFGGGKVLRDVVGVVAGFSALGASQSAIGTRFPMWDRVVRQPLIWAAGVDVAEVFGQNAKENPEALAHASLMGCLNAAFAGEWFRSAHPCSGRRGCHRTLGGRRGALFACSCCSAHSLRCISY